jgi:hypothetical protein
MSISFLYARTILGAVLTVALLNFSIEAMGMRWRHTDASDRGYEIFEVYKEYASQKPDVVAIGSSMTRWGLLPPSLKEKAEYNLRQPVEVWNLGLHGGTSTQIDSLLDLAFSNGRQPNVLLLQLGPSFWNGARLDNSTLLYWRWFAPLSHTLERAFSQPWEQTNEGLVNSIYGPRALWLNLAPILYPEKRRDRLQKEEKSRLQFGSFWGSNDLRRDLGRHGALPPIAVRAAKAQKSDQLLLVRPWEVPFGWEEQLQSVLRRCEENGTHLIAWVPPVSAELRNGALKEMAEWNLWASSAATSQNFPLWNYIDEPSVLPGMFFNMSHLAPTGAMQVGVLLADRLSPYLKK